MKKYILYTLLFIGATMFSCQEDNEYTLNEYVPIGGFTQADYTIESEQYLKNSTESVEVIFNFNRLNGTTSNFTIEVSEIFPTQYIDAFTLTIL